MLKLSDHQLMFAKIKSELSNLEMNDPGKWKMMTLIFFAK